MLSEGGAPFLVRHRYPLDASKALLAIVGKILRVLLGTSLISFVLVRSIQGYFGGIDRIDNYVTM